MSRDRVAKKRRRITLIVVVAFFVLFFFFSEKNPLIELKKLNPKLGELVQSAEEYLGFDKKSSIVVDKLVNKKLEVHLIDVGQGEAILIRTQNNDILIDAGEVENGRVVVDYLKNLGIEKLELIVATHPHSDHIGGMSEVIDSFEVGQFAMPDIPDSLVPTSNVFSKMLASLDNKGLMIVSIDSETSYQFDSAFFTVLSPMGEVDNLNDLSAVIRLDVDDVSFLFTGDVEKGVEKLLLEASSDIEVDVLNLAHHGSKTSTTEEFLQKVSPEIAIISCGIDNSYGHPHREVIDRLADLNVSIYRTDLDGTVVVETDGQEIVVSTQKDDGE